MSPCASKERTSVPIRLVLSDFYAYDTSNSLPKTSLSEEYPIFGSFKGIQSWN